MCVFVDVITVPLLACQVLRKGFWSRNFGELGDISLALCWCIVLQEGRPRLDVSGVRQSLRFIKWGLGF